ncbi:MAG: PAS domain S-box protein, partial [Chloroflexota bacterium]
MEKKKRTSRIAEKPRASGTREASPDQSPAKEEAPADATRRASEESFRALIENSLDGIAVIDGNGIVKYRSPSVERILGYGGEEFKGQAIFEAIHPDDLNFCVERFAQLVQTPGETMRANIRFRHRDGRWLWLESSGANFLGDPSIGGIVANFRDITERVRGEGRLAVQHAVTLALSEAASLAEAMPKILQAVREGLDWKRGECWCAHWSVDKQALRLRCAETCQASSDGLAKFDAATREFEFAPGEGLPGRVWQSGKPEWIPDLARDHFARVVPAAEAGLHSAFAFPVKLGSEVLGVMTFLDGDIRPPDECQLQLMESIGRQIGQFVERKRAETALRASERRFRALIENSADAIALLDREGRLLPFHSEAAGRILGYEMEENEGRGILELTHPDDRERVAGELARLA